MTTGYTILAASIVTPLLIAGGLLLERGWRGRVLRQLKEAADRKK